MITATPDAQLTDTAPRAPSVLGEDAPNDTRPRVAPRRSLSIRRLLLMGRLWAEPLPRGVLMGLDIDDVGGSTTRREQPRQVHIAQTPTHSASLDGPIILVGGSPPPPMPIPIVQGQGQPPKPSDGTGVAVHGDTSAVVRHQTSFADPEMGDAPEDILWKNWAARCMKLPQCRSVLSGDGRSEARCSDIPSPGSGARASPGELIDGRSTRVRK